jgi:hypothetical protein
VSAGGELDEPAGEVDSCLEQAANSASEPTHNNRTLRFIRSPHYCNGTVTRALPAWAQRRMGVASRVPAPLHRVAPGQQIPATPRPGALEVRTLVSFVFLKEPCGDLRCDHGLGKMPAAGDFEQ